MKTLTLATFSVRGLTKPHKQHQMVRDVIRYRINVCVIQETKVQQLSDASLDNHRVIFFESKSPHYGNGFIVSLQLKNSVHKYWYVSDKVSVLQIKLSNTKKCAYNIKETSSEFKNSVSLKVQRNGESYKCLPIPKITIKHEFIPDPKHTISIINVYAPTTQLAKDDASVLENFYSDVSTVLNELKNKSLVFLTGDWNAKVGKKIKQNASGNCIGSFARGVRNNSGQHLVNFGAFNNLFLSNTAFQHKAAHITTWEHKRVNPKDLTKTIQKQKIKHSLINARSFSGTEISSDHRLVNCKLEAENYSISKTKHKTHSKSYNTFQLIKSEETKNAY